MAERIVVVGSINADLVVCTDRFPAVGETRTATSFSTFSGGKGANQAYGAARLGARVSMIGQLGADREADWLCDHLRAAGVDVSAVRRDPSVSSGVAVIVVDGEGKNQILLVPGANGTFSRDRLLAS